MVGLDFELFILPKLQKLIQKNENNEQVSEIVENLKEMESDVKEYITQKQGMSRLYLLSSSRYINAFQDFDVKK